MAKKKIETSIEGNVVTVTLTVRNTQYVGVAKCHEDDMDFFSENIGQYIAEQRAMIKYQKARKREAEYRIKLYNHFINSTPQLNDYRKKLRLSSDITLSDEFIIYNANNDIKIHEQNIKDYIQMKGDFQDKVRARRERVQTLELQSAMLQRTGISSNNPFIDNPDYRGMTYLGELCSHLSTQEQ